jgi:hypothetical protein
MYGSFRVAVTRVRLGMPVARRAPAAGLRLLDGPDGGDPARVPPDGSEGAQDEEGGRRRGQGQGQAAARRVDGGDGDPDQRREAGGSQRGRLPRRAARQRRRGQAAVRGPRAAPGAERHREPRRLHHRDPWYTSALKCTIVDGPVRSSSSSSSMM